MSATRVYLRPPSEPTVNYYPPALVVETQPKPGRYPVAEVTKRYQAGNLGLDEVRQFELRHRIAAEHDFHNQGI